MFTKIEPSRGILNQIEARILSSVACAKEIDFTKTLQIQFR